MKVLFLTNEFPPHIYGGAGVHVDYLSRELAKLMKMEVRCFGDQNDDNPDFIIKGIQKITAMAKNAPEGLKSTFDTLLRSMELAAFKTDADVVHCHTWYSHFGGILAKLLYEIPLVITTHSLEPLRPWKREQLGTGYNLSSWVEKTAIEMADYVIAVSKETKEDVLNYFDVDPDKIVIIPNGIDIDEYKHTTDRDYLEANGIPEGLPYVLFVGRITRQKGIIHLVNAIKDIDPRLGVVLCAGAPDTPEIGEEMAAKVSEIKKTRENVFWVQEMLPRAGAIQMYSHASIFCCPSIYEPFGIINLEAMACDTPVVASAVGGIKEVVLDGETGVLVPLKQETKAPFEPEDPAKFSLDLAQGINKLFANPGLMKSMAEKGRKRAKDEYSWKAIAESVLNLYKKAGGEKK